MKHFENVAVLIADEQRTRHFSIRKTYCRLILPALIGLLLIVISLAVACVYFARSGSLKAEQLALSNAKNQQLQQEIVQLQNENNQSLATRENALRQAETTLEQLNRYLKSRGVPVKKISLGQAHSENSSASFMTVNQMKEFSINTENLLRTVRKVPLGRPHPGRVSSPFGLRVDPVGKKHYKLHAGMDFKGPVGDRIRATADGIVAFAGKMNGYGNVVRILHGYGYETRYAHLSKVAVHVGQRISAGEQVGKLGSTGHSTGPHLHYEVRLANQPINPAGFLSLTATR